MLFVWILAFVAFCFAVIALRFALSRLFTAIKIKCLCRNKFKLKSACPLWYLRNKSTKNAELLIETEKELLSVKLLGSYRKNTKFFITQSGCWFIRKYYAFLSSKSIDLQYTDSKPRPLSDFAFVADARKPIRKIILVTPKPLEIKYQKFHGTDIIVNCGDNLFGLEIHTLDSFLKALK
ncbi:MAG: hypothetical protein IKM32_04055 [Clostridia bacterium]|nr:hypothetical protein [Clostridia bacterium]